MKVRNIKLANKLTDIPNIGKSIAEDLELIGIKKPMDLVGKDAFILYKKMCKREGIKIDPCMIDVLMSAIYFADGGEARKWWRFTAERKRLIGLNFKLKHG